MAEFGGKFQLDSIAIRLGLSIFFVWIGWQLRGVYFLCVGVIIIVSNPTYNWSDHMKDIRRIITVMLAAAAFFLLFSAEVTATHCIVSGKVSIMVDDELFEVWAYGGGGGNGFPHVRLRDMAYILNGTQAQFDIRESADCRFDYWIVRGAPYAAAGTELQPIPYARHMLFGSYGFFYWEGFDSYPTQTAVLGVDGADEPAGVIAVSVFQDVDDMFFSLPDMAYLLGYNLEWGSWNEDLWIHHIIETDASAPAEIPVQSIEFIGLMVRLTGHWIDVAYRRDPSDESHMYFALSVHGFSDSASRFVNSAALNRETSAWIVPWWYPVSVRNIEGGFELTIDDMYNHRIIIGAEDGQIDRITLYIGDTSYNMVRLGSEEERLTELGRDAVARMSRFLRMFFVK